MGSPVELIKGWRAGAHMKAKNERFCEKGCFFFFFKSSFESLEFFSQGYISQKKKRQSMVTFCTFDY